MFLRLKTGCQRNPQGNVLGPILFIFYINDFIEKIPDQSIAKLYADDLKASNSCTKGAEEAAFNETLASIEKWADPWQLPISSEKSKWICISNKPQNPMLPEVSFELAGTVLPQTSDVVDLGVKFNSKLNFGDHISSIIAKAKQRLFLLKKIFISKNAPILILSFKTYVMPLLEYCSQVWSPSNISDIRRIESVQRMFTKKLAGYQGLSYSARLEKAGLCTLELRRLRTDLCFCYKLLHGQIDTPAQTFLEIDSSRQTRRHSWKLKTIAPRLDTRLNFFSCRVVKPWNHLSQSTVEANSFESFRGAAPT